MSIVKADETANDLFNRLHKSYFHMKLNSMGGVEALSFQEMVEIVAQPNEVAEIILSSALEFSIQYEQGVIIHVSTGNTLFHALNNSGIDLSTTNMHRFHQQGRLRASTIHNSLQLLALIEYIRTNVVREKTILLLECLTTLLSMEKTSSGILPRSSLSYSILTALQNLAQTRQVIIVWVNPATLKNSSAIRESHPKDPLSILWKQKVQKLLFYNFVR